MSPYVLAQLNVAQMKAPLDSPVMAEFVANLDRINTLAEQSPGFIWRLKDDSGDATAFRPMGDTTLINISVWQDVAALSAYVYGAGHVDIMRQRKSWMDKMSEAHLVLWWVPSDHRPNEQEAIARLEHLRKHGPTAEAFSFRDSFPPPA
jgi:Domain of unknown function (DUF3291)